MKFSFNSRWTISFVLVVTCMLTGSCSTGSATLAEHPLVKNHNYGWIDLTTGESGNLDTPPRPESGYEAIEDEISLPMMCDDPAVAEAFVLLEFVVDQKGQTGNFKIVRSNGGCGDSLMRVLYSASFEPATRDGQNVPSVVQRLFRFKSN